MSQELWHHSNKLARWTLATLIAANGFYVDAMTLYMLYMNGCCNDRSETGI